MKAIIQGDSDWYLYLQKESAHKFLDQINSTEIEFINEKEILLVVKRYFQYRTTDERMKLHDEMCNEYKQRGYSFSASYYDIHIFRKV